MRGFLANVLSFMLIGLIFIGFAFFIALIIFLFFVGGVWLGGFCGWLLSYTVMGAWVHHALIALGHDMNLTYLGALLGFIGSVLNIKLVNPVIGAAADWFLKHAVGKGG